MDPVGLNFTDTELIKYIFYEEVKKVFRFRNGFFRLEIWMVVF